MTRESSSMALKATIHKARIQLADMDRNVYRDHSVTIARHPSETDDRLLVRLLVLALQSPEDPESGPLELGKDLWEPDEPSLLQKDLTGRIVHWIDIGQPDERRLLRVSSRVERLTVYGYHPTTATWWQDLAHRVTRLSNLTVWQIPSEQARALGELAQRAMDLQMTVQDGVIWLSDDRRSVEVTPQRLRGELPR